MSQLKVGFVVFTVVTLVGIGTTALVGTWGDLASVACTLVPMGVFLFYLVRFDEALVVRIDASPSVAEDAGPGALDLVPKADRGALSPAQDGELTTPLKEPI